MNAEEAVQVYPNLKGLYIPKSGEIIHWGKGHAIIVQSPFDGLGGKLMAISLNADGLFVPFEVDNHLAMGPHEAIPRAEQVKLPDYYDHNFNFRFSKVFRKHHWVMELWDKYRFSKNELA